MSPFSRVSSLGIEHFGERLRGTKFGHKMTRGLYAYPNRSTHERLTQEEVGEELWGQIAWAYSDREHKRHSDAYLLVQRDAALVNFDLSMEYFASLDADEFEASLEHVLVKGRTFKPVQSLQDWDGVPGAYVMVFDEYRQFYVGQSEDIRRRIKQHWGNRKPFSRVIFGSKYDSILPVDELRATDTTRIFAARSRNPHGVEERTEKAADQRFCLNRMVGGSASPLKLMLTAINPRQRSIQVSSLRLSFEEYERARDGVANIVGQAGPAPGSSVAAELARLDMSIYSVDDADGSVFLWSRRDSISLAVVRGELSVDAFASFLRELGEEIIWPVDA